MILEKTCPHCGAHLIIRDGQFGEFLACPRYPHCKYTQSIYHNSDGYTDDLDEYKPPSPYCKRCNQTGLLPFVKNGKVSPHTFLHCECRIEADSREHYFPLKPDDFDYPMSMAFRAFSYDYCGVTDPGYVSLKPDVSDLDDRINDLEAISAQPGSIPRYYDDRTQQVENKVTGLQNKLNELIDKRKGKQEKITGIIPL